MSCTAVADRRVAGRKRAGDRLDGRLLGQRDHSRRRDHGHIAAAERGRGVGFLDAAGDARGHPGGQRHLRTIGTPPVPAGSGRKRGAWKRSLIEAPVLERTLRGRAAQSAASSPRCSPRIAAEAAAASTTAGSRSSPPAARAARASASCAATPPGSRTPPIWRDGARRSGRSRGRGGARRWWRGAARSRSTRRPVGAARDRGAARVGAEGAQGRAAAASPTPRPGPRAARSVRSPRRTPTRGGGSSSPTPTGCSPATTRSAPASACRRSPPATPGCRPATRRPGRTIGFEYFDEFDVERDRRAPRPAGRSRCSTPGPRRAVRCPSCSRRARARCCSTRRAVTVSKPTSCSESASVFDGKVGEQVASPLVTPHRRRHATRASGARSRSTTKAAPRSATCSSRTACSPTTCGTTCAPGRPAARRAGTAAARRTSTCRWCG